MTIESEIGKGSTFTIELLAKTIDVDYENQIMKPLNELSEKINIEFSDIVRYQLRICRSSVKLS